MDSAFLHARSLFEFFTKEKESRNYLTVKNFGSEPLCSKIYKDWEASLHCYLMHLQDRLTADLKKKLNGRKIKKDIKNQVVEFAKEIIRLWIEFSDDTAMKNYKELLDEKLCEAFKDAEETARKYDIEMPFKIPRNPQKSKRIIKRSKEKSCKIN
jgi:hypothetical protein